MAKIKDDSFYELFDKAIGAAQGVNDKDKANDNLMVKQAKVIGYDSDTYKTFVCFIDDLNQTSYTIYNKTGENLSEGDTVKVYYTSNPAKGWIGMRCGEPDIKNSGEGVGRKSPWDVTSEYFNSYEGDAMNIAGDEINGNQNTGGRYQYAHAEGYNTKATGSYSHAEGYSSKAVGAYSHAEGKTIASGDYSHAEGKESIAKGYASHVEGDNCSATGSSAHAEGAGTSASGTASHAEGVNTQATGSCSHAEGSGCKVTGRFSHAEGENCEATKDWSHAGGSKCIADGKCSFVHGVGLKAISYSTAVFGKYNAKEENPLTRYLFVIGNGSGDNDRSNAFTVDEDGNVTCKSISGEVVVNGFTPFTAAEIDTIFDSVMV